MKNANTPAMPLHDAQQNMAFVNTEAQGLTKREYFAAMAMQGLALDCKLYGEKRTAVSAVNLADALLAELERTYEPD